jgi:hypothetical protein
MCFSMNYSDQFLIHTISFVVTSFQPHSCIEKTIAYSSFILISNIWYQSQVDG